MGATFAKVMDQGQEVDGRTGQAIKSRDEHHFAGADLSKQALKLGTIGGLAGQLFFVDDLASGGGQGVKLSIQLLFGGGNAGVADKRGHEQLVVLVLRT